MPHFVYFLRSENDPNKTYCGRTQDLDTRLKQHNNGENTSTRVGRPWRIEAYVECDTEHTSDVVERYFKNTSGREKFDNFEAANPNHPNPKQGFFDTLEGARGFGSKERRFIVTQNDGKTIFVMAN